MQNNHTDQNPERDSNCKDNQRKPQKLSTTETKARKRKLIKLEWGFWVLVAVAGSIFFVNHILALISIPLLLLGLISGAFALRLSLINHGARKRDANLACVCVALPTVILCGYVFWVEITNGPPPTNTTAAWTPPELPPNCTNVYLSYGGNSSEMTPEEIKKAHFININGFEPFKWRVDSNRFYVDVDIPYEDRIINLRGGKSSSQLPPMWDMNFTSNALEIVTISNNPIYQVYYRRPDEIALGGVFAKGGMMVAFTSKGMEWWSGTNNVRSNLNAFYSGQKPTGLAPIFKYPSFKHKGEYSDD